MRKLVSLLLVLCICLASVAAFAEVTNVNVDSVWPVVNEKVSVTIGVVPQQAGEYDTDSMWITKLWADNTNLDIEWKIIDSSTAKEKIPLMLAGDTMPDALMGWYSFNQAKLVQYGVDEGMLYPLDELFQYMPNLSALMEEKPQIRAAMTAPDGHVYGLPDLGDGSITSYAMRFFINHEWLKSVGKEMPETLDDLFDVLCAFRDQDANGNGIADDEIPLCVSWNGSYKLRGYILNAFGFSTTNSSSTLRYNEDGSTEAVYVPLTEEYKAYLTYMHKLWTENLLDKDMFTQDQNQVDAKFVDGVAGISSNAGLKAVAPARQYDYECFHPLTSEYSSKKIMPQTALIAHAGMFVINSNCDEEKAAVLANFADSFYNPYTCILYKYGPTYSETETLESEYGQLFCNEYGQYYDTETNSSVYVFNESVYPTNWDYRTRQMSFWAVPGYATTGNTDWVAKYAEAFPTTMIGMQEKAKNNGSYVKTDNMEITAVDNWIPYYTPMLPNFYYSTEDLARVNELSVLLDDYVNGAEAKFIVGDLSIENDFDAFMKDLETYGAYEYADLLTKYWEAYNK